MYSLDISEPISCISAGKLMHRNGWDHDGREFKDGNVMMFIIDGTATVRYGDEVYELTRGSIMIIPRGVFYTANTDDFCEYYFFHFNGKITKCDEAHFIKQSSVQAPFYIPHLDYDRLYFENGINVKDSYDEIYSTLRSFFEYKAMRSTYGRLMLDHKLMEIFIFMYGRLEDAAPTPKRPILVNKIIMYISTHITRPLTVAEICEVHRISPSYAVRVFKKHMGCTLIGYINQEKMYYARELIKRSSMNITEIADYLSICDVYYFSKLFKQTFGISPSEYKKNGEHR